MTIFFQDGNKGEKLQKVNKSRNFLLSNLIDGSRVNTRANLSPSVPPLTLTKNSSPLVGT